MKLDDAVVNMLRSGMTPSFVSEVSGVPFAKVSRLAEVSSVDQEFESMRRVLITAAMDECMLRMRRGTSAERTRLITFVLGSFAKQGREQEREIEEMRRLLTKLIETEHPDDDDEFDDPDRYTVGEDEPAPV